MRNEIQTPAAEASAAKNPGKIGNVINIIINVILVLAIILAAVCTYVSFVSTSGNGVPNLFGYEMFSVQTDSMYPALKPGDLVIDRAVRDTSALRKGNIITYWTVIEGERVLNTHRINEIYDGGGYLIFETKGDNNSAADTLTVHESEVVGVYQTHIAGLGKVLDYLQTSKGFLIVIVIPVALFFLFHLIQFFRVLFEYQNIKSRLKYQEELDAKGTDTDAPVQTEPAAVDKAAIEAQLREKIKAEMMAEMLAELKKQNATQAEASASQETASAEGTPAEEEAPAEEETPTEEEAPTEEEVPAEDEASAEEETSEKKEAPAEEAPQTEAEVNEENKAENAE